MCKVDVTGMSQKEKDQLLDALLKQAEAEFDYETPPPAVHPVAQLTKWYFKKHQGTKSSHIVAHSTSISSNIKGDGAKNQQHWALLGGAGASSSSGIQDGTKLLIKNENPQKVALKEQPIISISIISNQVYT